MAFLEIEPYNKYEVESGLGNRSFALSLIRSLLISALLKRAENWSTEVNHLCIKEITKGQESILQEHCNLCK